MKRYQFLLLIIPFATLSACASYYKAPPGVPTATMHFNSNMSPVIIQAFQDEKCTPIKYGVRLAYIDPSFDSTGKFAGPTTIEANKLLVFTLRKHNLPGTNWSCTVTLSFTPQTDAEYVASLRNIGDGKCEATLSLSIAGQLETVPGVKEIKDICYDPNG